MEVDNEEGWDPLLHVGVEPGSVLCLAFCSDALSLSTNVDALATSLCGHFFVVSNLT